MKLMGTQLLLVATLLGAGMGMSAGRTLPLTGRQTGEAAGSAVQEPAASPQTLLGSAELRRLVQGRRQELLGRLVRNDPSQLAGSGGFLTKLELEPAQHRELGRIMASRQARAESVLQDAQAAAAATSDPARRSEIAAEAYGDVASLAEEALREFQAGLLPHQAEQLEQMLGGLRLQAILQVAQLHDQPWPRVAAADLELSAGAAENFHREIAEAIDAYRQKMAKIREELAGDLRAAAPAASQAAWAEILGNEPHQLAEFLTASGVFSH